MAGEKVQMLLTLQFIVSTKKHPTFIELFFFEETSLVDQQQV
jgi:hypothetical protein